MMCGVVHAVETRAVSSFLADRGYRRRGFGDNPAYDVCEQRGQLETMFTPDFINALFPQGRSDVARDAELYDKIRSYRRRIDRDICLFRAADSAREVDPRYLDITLRVECIDCYFFPAGIMIYAVTADIAGISIADYMTLAADIRMVNFYPDPQPRVRNLRFTDEFLALFHDALCIKAGGAAAAGDLSHDLFRGNKLYTYTALRLDTNSRSFGPGYDCMRLLADLTHGNEFGESAQHSDSPNRMSDVYLEHAARECSLSMYANWTAMASTDFFAVIADNSLPEWAFSPWRGSRYMIFLNALMSKSMLIKISAESHSKDIDARFEAEFLKLDRVVNPPIISYNELPRELCDLMRRAFGVTSQLDIIEERISKNAEKKRDRMEQVQNYILFALAVLGIFEAVEAFNSFARRNEWLTWSNAVMAAVIALILVFGLRKWNNYRKL